MQALMDACYSYSGTEETSDSDEESVGFSMTASDSKRKKKQEREDECYVEAIDKIQQHEKAKWPRLMREMLCMERKAFRKDTQDISRCFTAPRLQRVIKTGMPDQTETEVSANMEKECWLLLAKASEYLIIDLVDRANICADTCGRRTIQRCDLARGLSKWTGTWMFTFLCELVPEKYMLIKSKRGKRRTSPPDNVLEWVDLGHGVTARAILPEEAPDLVHKYSSSTEGTCTPPQYESATSSPQIAPSLVTERSNSDAVSSAVAPSMDEVPEEEDEEEVKFPAATAPMPHGPLPHGGNKHSSEVNGRSYDRAFLNGQTPMPMGSLDRLLDPKEPLLWSLQEPPLTTAEPPLGSGSYARHPSHTAGLPVSSFRDGRTSSVALFPAYSRGGADPALRQMSVYPYGPVQLPGPSLAHMQSVNDWYGPYTAQLAPPHHPAMPPPYPSVGRYPYTMTEQCHGKDERRAWTTSDAKTAGMGAASVQYATSAKFNAWQLQQPNDVLLGLRANVLTSMTHASPTAVGSLAPSRGPVFMAATHQYGQLSL